MSGLRECIDFLLDALVHDLLYVCIYRVPDRSVAVLGLINSVKSLSYAVDRIVVGVGINIPLFPLKLLQVVLSFDIFDELIPVELNVELLFYESPCTFDNDTPDETLVDLELIRIAKEWKKRNQ